MRAIEVKVNEKNVSVAGKVQSFSFCFKFSNTPPLAPPPPLNPNIIQNKTGGTRVVTRPPGWGVWGGNETGVWGWGVGKK